MERRWGLRGHRQLPGPGGRAGWACPGLRAAWWTGGDSGVASPWWALVGALHGSGRLAAELHWGFSSGCLEGASEQVALTVSILS